MPRPRHRAGQDLRTGSAPYERATNAHQRRLVAAYDRWASVARVRVRQALERGVPPSQLPGIMSALMSTLESELIDLGRRGILSAARTSVGRRSTQDSRTSGFIQNLVGENTFLIQSQLVPNIRESIIRSIQNAWPVVPGSLPDLVRTVFDAQRSKVAQYGGGAWVAIFEVQRQVGRQTELDSGERQRVRWNLHPLADHCSASPGKFGCPDLARIYDSWNDLPTVPAGEVTCRGNCRCWLEVEIEGQWQRGLTR